MDWYYDRDGAAITAEQWGEKHADESYMRVGLWGEWDGPGPVVSTVWLGMNHSFDGGPPLIFETMLFGEPYEDNECVRYTTDLDAYEGHQRTVADLEAGRHPWFLCNEFRGVL